MAILISAAIFGTLFISKRKGEKYDYRKNDGLG